MTNKTAGDHAILRDSLYGTTSEPTYAGAVSFMRRKYTRDLEDVDLVVTGVLGPRAIRAASTIMAWERPYGMAFDPFDKLAVVDYGDCFFDFGRPETVPSTIEEHAYNIIDKGPGLLSLGGDHFVAYPLIKAHARKHGAPLSLLHFDAHSDSWNDEEGRVDHGTMFYHTVKEGIIDPKSSMQIGYPRRTLGS
jgi:agmatinase